MKSNNLILVIILVIGIVALSGCTAPKVNDTNTQQNSTQVSPTANNNIFENKYISFTKPDGLTITDNSTDKTLDIQLYKGSDFIGEISSFGANPSTYNDIFNIGTSTTIAGKKAVESYENTIDAYVDTGATSGNYKVLLNLNFDSDTSSAYNIVKNSLTIKQTPPIP